MHIHTKHHNIPCPRYAHNSPKGVFPDNYETWKDEKPTNKTQLYTFTAADAKS